MDGDNWNALLLLVLSGGWLFFNISFCYFALISVLLFFRCCFLIFDLLYFS